MEPSPPSTTPSSSKGHAARPGPQGTTALISNLAESAARHSYGIEKSIKAANPPLNLLTKTPVNTAKFTLKIGPVRDFQDAVINVFVWKNPPITVLWMLLWMFVCRWAGVCVHVRVRLCMCIAGWMGLPLCGSAAS